LLLSPERTYPNLFDAHPPFQIDGNFGGAAGILEMLVQSGEGWVHLLPALPSAWSNGSARGVCARGGLEIDLAWAGGRLTAAEITSSVAGMVRVLHRGKAVRAQLGPGETWRFPVQDATGAR
jgi:alpha-L-fucosidase 2